MVGQFMCDLHSSAGEKSSYLYPETAGVELFKG